MAKYQISKKRLAEIIKEEYESILAETSDVTTEKLTLDQLEIDEEDLEEGYMDALDRSREEEERQRSYDYDARERERKRNQAAGRTGVGTRMGGSYAKKRFAGFNRDEDGPKPDYLDLDKDGNKKEPMKKAAKDKKMNKESLKSIRQLIMQELKNL
tara:strand:- start:780 stop:1247 length:468 start_codon:yes stop_codon:yes gene_type:complete